MPRFDTRTPTQVWLEETATDAEKEIYHELSRIQSDLAKLHNSMRRHTKKLRVGQALDELEASIDQLTGRANNPAKDTKAKLLR